MSKKNHIGERFGRLLVLAENPEKIRGAVVWDCLCSCGKEASVSGIELRRGRVQSCGCLRLERLREVSVKSQTCEGHPLYSTYRGMLKRCYYPKADNYGYYGGRGIEVCGRWRESFWNFLEDMGERPEGHTLDRIEVDGDYCPDNCRWATYKDQVANRRCS